MIGSKEPEAPSGFSSYEVWLRAAVDDQALWISSPDLVRHALHRELVRTSVLRVLESAPNPPSTPASFVDGRLDQADLARRTLPTPNPKGFRCEGREI